MLSCCGHRLTSRRRCCARLSSLRCSSWSSVLVLSLTISGRPLRDALIDLLRPATRRRRIALPRGFAERGCIGGPLGAARPAHRLHPAPIFWGVVVALIFVGLPFVVRTVEPVFGVDLEREQEERRRASRLAAQSYGACGAASILSCRPCSTRLRAGAGRAVPAVRLGGSSSPARAGKIPRSCRCHRIKLEPYYYPAPSRHRRHMLAILLLLLLAAQLSGLVGQASMRPGHIAPRAARRPPPRPGNNKRGPPARIRHGCAALPHPHACLFLSRPSW